MSLWTDAVDEVDQAVSDTRKATDEAADKARRMTDEAARQAQEAADEAARQAQEAADEAARQADAAAAEARRRAAAIQQESKKKIDAAHEEFATTLASLQDTVDRAARDARNRIIRSMEQATGPGHPQPHDYAWFKFRTLTSDEIKLAKSVFEDSINFDQVYLANDLGLGGRAWTYQGHESGNILIHGGQRMYKDATQTGPYVDDDGSHIDSTFIHELTHVWQGQNWRRIGGFMSNSVVCQFAATAVDPARPFDGAYDYEKKRDKPWNTFGAEQQAELVECWYLEGMSTDEKTDWKFKYIRDNVRQAVD